MSEVGEMIVVVAEAILREELGQQNRVYWKK
jgi:hypothetical protein